MARKKKQTKPVEEVEATENAIGVTLTANIDPTKSFEENFFENTTIEYTPTEDTPKIKAIKEFAQLWATLPHYNYVTDKQAREIHKLWQIVTGRTDYYNNCSACLIAHVKTLKKIAKNEGITI